MRENAVPSELFDAVMLVVGEMFLEKERCGHIEKESCVGPVGPSVQRRQPLREPDAQERERSDCDWQQRVGRFGPSVQRRQPLRELDAQEREPKAERDWVQRAGRISGAAAEGFLMRGIALAEEGCTPAYLRHALRVEAARLIDSSLVWEEKRVILTLAELIPRFVQQGDVDFFTEIFSHECGQTTRAALFEKMAPYYPGKLGGGVSGRLPPL